MRRSNGRALGLGLSLSLVVVACAGTLHAAPERAGAGDAARSVGERPGTARASIRAALDLSVGGVGEDTLVAAASRPMVFTEVEKARALTGELVVQALPGRAGRGMARVAPSLVKTSAFEEGLCVITVPEDLDEGALAAALMATGDYAFVEPNWLVYPLGNVPNDPQYASSWQHNRIDSADAWELHTGGSDVIVAVCDSGVDLDHPDLAASLVSGYNSASNLAQVDGGDVDDINGHGTFVAGCAAARGNNAQGVVGVGWDFTVMPIRVTNSGNGTASSFDILEGARWAADNGAQIVNASFSGGASQQVQGAAKSVRDRGGLLFWASGNDNAYIDFDGADVVLVGSTTSSDNRSGFSNYGPAVDVTAPGSSVRSTRRGGGYGNGSGTSYASPIAAGVGAMIVSAGDGLYPLDVQDVLYQSVDDLGAPGRDDSYGRGRVNTRRAVEIAQSYEAKLPLPLIVDFEDAGAWGAVFPGVTGSPVGVVSAETTAIELGDGDALASVALSGPTVSAFNGYFGIDLLQVGAGSGAALTVEYTDQGGSWNTLYAYESAGESVGDGVRAYAKVPEAMRWHGVEVRVSSSGGSFVIDDFALENVNFDDSAVFPFSDGFDAGTVSPGLWDENDGAGAGPSGGSQAAVLSGGDSMVSRRVTTLEQLGEDLFLSMDVSGAPGVGAGDEFVIEVSRDAGLLGWTRVGSVAGDALGGGSTRVVIDVTGDIFLSTEARVRLSVVGDDAFFVDNVFLGTEVPSGACSGADLASPLGSLDFADASAFLTLFAQGDLAADLDGSGALDFGDVSSFLSLFGAGCP